MKTLIQILFIINTVFAIHSHVIYEVTDDFERNLDTLSKWYLDPPNNYYYLHYSTYGKMVTDGHNAISLKPGYHNDRNYLSAFDVMAYYELPQETEMWTKYSIEGIDVFHMYINKLHFNKISGGSGIFPLNGGYSPKIGDLIRSVYNNSYYEIVNVNHTEEMFLQFKHCWDLIVKPFKNERNIK